MKKHNLFILAFIEGSAVMALELLSGMMVAPFFGNTIVSWAIVLAITLGGLATGYGIGGTLSRNNHTLRWLQIMMITGGILFIILPIWGTTVMRTTMDLGLELGLIISLMLFLFPPLLMFGSISPLIVQRLTVNSKSAGNMTGTILGISTGGVLQQPYF